MTSLSYHESEYHHAKARILQHLQDQQLPLKITFERPPYENDAYSIEMNGGGHWDYPASITGGWFRLEHNASDMDMTLYASGAAEIFIPVEKIEYPTIITLVAPPGMSKEEALRDPQKYMTSWHPNRDGKAQKTSLPREEAAVALLAAKGYRGIASTEFPRHADHGARGMRYNIPKSRDTLEGILTDFSLKDVFRSKETAPADTTHE